MISAKFLWGNVPLGGKLQIDVKNSNFQIFESTLYMKSVNMPLNDQVKQSLLCPHQQYHYFTKTALVLKFHTNLSEAILLTMTLTG